jgi:hypothetical protein
VRSKIALAAASATRASRTKNWSVENGELIEHVQKGRKCKCRPANKFQPSSNVDPGESLRLSPARDLIRSTQIVFLTSIPFRKFVPAARSPPGVAVK